jgi:hypothetical protein
MAILSFIFWWAALPLEAILLWVLFRKRVFRIFPWFYASTLFSVIGDISRLIFRYQKGPAYYYVYYGTEATYALFGFAVMYEVFRHVLRNFQRIRWFRPVFPVTIVLTVILTALRAFNRPARFRTQMAEWVIGAEMGERFLQVSMFVLLVVLVTVFGLRWRQHAFGICAGYGIYATVALLATTKFYEIGTRFTFWWGVMSVAAYNVAVLIWLWYFSGPVIPEPPRAGQPPLSGDELERYRRIVRRVPPS